MIADKVHMCGTLLKSLITLSTDGFTLMAFLTIINTWLMSYGNVNEKDTFIHN